MHSCRQTHLFEQIGEQHREAVQRRENDDRDDNEAANEILGGSIAALAMVVRSFSNRIKNTRAAGSNVTAMT